jgi:hypothetical protein
LLGLLHQSRNLRADLATRSTAPACNNSSDATLYRVGDQPANLLRFRHDGFEVAQLPI